MDEVDCGSTQIGILGCYYTSSHDCSHGEDVLLECGMYYTIGSAHELAFVLTLGNLTNFVLDEATLFVKL